MTRLLTALLFAVLLSACGEPALDVDFPPRDGHVADLAGILDTDALNARLAEVAAEGLDVVALTYTTEQANCGEAFRAGRAFATEWDADVAVVAVARPGDFTSTDDDRVRCLGLRPVDDFAVSRGVREDIAEVLVPPIAATNDWDQAFLVAADRLAEELARGSGDPTEGGDG